MFLTPLHEIGMILAKSLLLTLHKPAAERCAGFFMPSFAARPCRSSGCGALVRDGGGYCPAHKRAARKEVDSRRESSTKRGYGYKWQKARAQFLIEHPLCQCPECQEGKVRLLKAEVVDHIIPHKGDEVLFWDRNNWQSMTKDCHDKKTASEDGGFGNPRCKAG